MFLARPPVRRPHPSDVGPFRWGREDLVAAARSLGWAGDVGVLTAFHGTRFVAVVDPREEPRGPGSNWLVGCLVPGENLVIAMREASTLAPYSRRAVLLPEGCDIADLAFRASVLDQGVVAVGQDGLAVIAPAGPVATSPLIEDAAWKHNRRWHEFEATVRASIDQLAIC